MPQQPKAWQHATESRHKRGYGYAWTKKREQILMRDGYRCRCAECKASGDLKPATEVDHILSKAAWLKRFGNLNGVDADANLQAINRDCHKMKSLMERGFDAREPVRVGEDGFPVGR